MPITDDLDIDNLFNPKKRTPLEETASSDNIPRLNLMGLARSKRKKLRKTVLRKAIKRHCKRK